MSKIYELTELTELPSVVEQILQKLRSKRNHLGATGLCLSGDLGAGKTTFTQVLARELGVSETVQSPTYVIMKRYETKDAEFPVLIHIDAYRIEALTELRPLRLAEIFAIPRALVCIEWAERIMSALPPDWWRLQIEVTSDNGRRLTLQGD